MSCIVNSAIKLKAQWVKLSGSLNSLITITLSTIGTSSAKSLLQIIGNLVVTQVTYLQIQIFGGPGDCSEKKFLEHEPVANPVA